ncbi:hypothetical protein P879_04014 [Paragonimus westermani]|uniref:Calpain catalytic domain-containing protein n=1 Tax=Paragonimus westermani TaxID=34504 RepID=A0A8T0DB07_9TREM|nr:hypothetical protein P879_04014 [Paragonimus westermani]
MHAVRVSYCLPEDGDLRFTRAPPQIHSVNVFTNTASTELPSGKKGELHENYTETRKMGDVEYFELIRQMNKTDCLWQDPDFPATLNTLTSVAFSPAEVVWKRPKDIHPEATVAFDENIPFTLNQGLIGSHNLIGGLVTTAMYPRLLTYVVPDQQNLEEVGYVGVFRTFFWVFGSWKQVLVDDRVPVDQQGQFLFLHSNDPRVLWPCLLEKAYANHGLVDSHLYNITKIIHVRCDGEKICLVKLCDFYGDAPGWTGPWGLGSSDSMKLSRKDRSKLELSTQSEKEFWISTEDLVKHFAYLTVCHTNMKPLVWEKDKTEPLRMSETQIYGQWKFQSAGGSPEYSTSFHQNPQYLLRIEPAVKTGVSKDVTVYLSLMLHSENRSYWNVAACLYKVNKEPTDVLDCIFFQRRTPLRTQCSNGRRELVATLFLQPGIYIVVPFTECPGQEMKFLMRIYCCND